MTVDEWRKAVAADRPPITPAQLAILRPLWRTSPAMQNAAPDGTGAAPAETHREVSNASATA